MLHKVGTAKNPKVKTAYCKTVNVSVIAAKFYLSLKGITDYDIK